MRPLLPIFPFSSHFLQSLICIRKYSVFRQKCRSLWSLRARYCCVWRKKAKVSHYRTNKKKPARLLSMSTRLKAGDAIVVAVMKEKKMLFLLQNLFRFFRFVIKASLNFHLLSPFPTTGVFLSHFLHTTIFMHNGVIPFWIQSLDFDLFCFVFA